MAIQPGKEKAGSSVFSDSQQPALFNFRFQIYIGTGESSEVVRMGGFTECSAIVYEQEVKEFREGGLNDIVHKIPGQAKYSNITIKGLQLLESRMREWKWASAKDDKPIRRTTIRIDHLNPYVDKSGQGSESQDVVERWTLKDAWIVKWTSSKWDAKSSDFSIEEAEIAFEDVEYEAVS